MAALPVRTARTDLAHYDPQKGLKAIAVAEAAERHFERATRVAQDRFQRAKNATRLLQAVELNRRDPSRFRSDRRILGA